MRRKNILMRKIRKILIFVLIISIIIGIIIGINRDKTNKVIEIAEINKETPEGMTGRGYMTLNLGNGITGGNYTLICEHQKEQLCHVCYGSNGNWLLEQQVCPECNGMQNITCSICQGRRYIEKPINCPNCGGKRIITYVCPNCGGERYIDDQPCENCGAKGNIDEPCNLCGATGQIVEMEQCPACNGIGTVSCPNCQGNGFIEIDVFHTCPNCNGEGYELIPRWNCNRKHSSKFNKENIH